MYINDLHTACMDGVSSQPMSWMPPGMGVLQLLLAGCSTVGWCRGRRKTCGSFWWLIFGGTSGYCSGESLCQWDEVPAAVHCYELVDTLIELVVPASSSFFSPWEFPTPTVWSCCQHWIGSSTTWVQISLLGAAPLWPCWLVPLCKGPRWHSSTRLMVGQGPCMLVLWCLVEWFSGFLSILNLY